MASHPTAETYLDLTDEAALLSESVDEERPCYDPTGVRALLAALNLKPVSGPMVDGPTGNVLDLAVYRATGDRRLATLFGTAA
ncbi:MAG: hypothetical protein R8F63_12125 [Acidimicrobiales bacterium]|nr:hypothetical protein [Acidimicrobiales bacterium]